MDSLDTRRRAAPCAAADACRVRHRLGRARRDSLRKHEYAELFWRCLDWRGLDLPPFLVNDNAEFELHTLLLRWGVLAVSGVALYVARRTRLCIRLPNKAI